MNKNSTFHRLRVTAADKLSSLLPYTSYSINKNEYIGEFKGSVSECIKALRDKGYSYQMLAAVKSLENSNDVGSFSRIPRVHPIEAKGTKLYDLPVRECQYHVHLFEDGENVKLYGHYEVHPYPHIPHWDIKRPYPRHYRPTWDKESAPKEEWSYLRGLRDNRLDSILHR